VLDGLALERHFVGVGTDPRHLDADAGMTGDELEQA
jgi:hypothetical protein